MGFDVDVGVPAALDAAEGAIDAVEPAPAPGELGAVFAAAGADADGVEVGAAGTAGFAGAAGAGVDSEAEQQLFGTTILGAATPAISEPNPNFCSVGASSLPVASILCADWNFCTAATVSASHFPEGSPV